MRSSNYEGGRTLKKRLAVLSAVTLLVLALFALSAWAKNAEMWFSTNKLGTDKKTEIQEGDEVWIVILDSDKNLDSDLLDKISPDLKIMDPKTGAYIVWNSWDARGADNTDGVITNYDYLEETAKGSGMFVSNRPFQVGTRESFDLGEHGVDEYDRFTHVVDNTTPVDDFQWGHYLYGALGITDGIPASFVNPDLLGYFTKPAPGPDPVGVDGVFGDGETWTEGLLGNGIMPHDDGVTDAYMIGRFENMDTLVGMYQDTVDRSDVAMSMMKIYDSESKVEWSDEIYTDGRKAASITIWDLDENLNCDEVEYVPVFIMVNPGSWNVQSDGDVTNFCDLKRLGGYDGEWNGDCEAAEFTPGDPQGPITWFNIYEQRFIQLPVEEDVTAGDNVSSFDTLNADGWVPVTFWAQETGTRTGIFKLNLNSIFCDLGYRSLRTGDVLVAYYLDPNDEDDFSLDVAYIEENQTSITSWVDSGRVDVTTYWLGRDDVYVQVIDENANLQACCPDQVVVSICDPHGTDDSEWITLNEVGPNSGVFLTTGGTELLPVWDARGRGISSDVLGGYQLVLDNWRLEAFNEDHVYAQYNDVTYADGLDGKTGLGDEDTLTAFPPLIEKVRDQNDVSFDLMAIGDTQVFDGKNNVVNMWFIDRQGGQITTGYTSSDGVYIQVKDPDQNEDPGRIEIIRAYWDGGQNAPFGPQQLNEFDCNSTRYPHLHFVNPLLGSTSIFPDQLPADSQYGLYTDAEAVFADQADVEASNEPAGWPKIYVLNPRNGRWAALDLWEDPREPGVFTSVICVNLSSPFDGCVPNLDVMPNDTVLAFYQDPSNHSDSTMIALKVGPGGGGTPTSQKSTTEFTTILGAKVTSYTDADLVYVKVKDPSHNGETTLTDAVTIGAIKYDLVRLDGAATDTFITMPGLDLNLTAGMPITATYKDPTDSTDTSTAGPITIVGSALVIEDFYAGPTPSAGDVTFGYIGSGIAAEMSVEVYDFAGHLLWQKDATDVAKIVWDGKSGGVFVANGVYRYFVKASDGTASKSGVGFVVINR